LYTLPHLPLSTIVLSLSIILKVPTPKIISSETKRVSIVVVSIVVFLNSLSSENVAVNEFNIA